MAAGRRPCYALRVPLAAPSLLATLGVGLSLGLLHALDADHLVAVSALVSERPSPQRSALVGLAWGLGHATALGAAGVAVLLLGRAIPPGLGAWFDLAVAVMLVVVGAQAVRRGLDRTVLHAHVHAHGGEGHVHRHLHVAGTGRHDGRLHALTHAGRRPFVVGFVHGLAGSAALTLVVLATIPSPALGLVYVAVFGVGSIAGMATVSALLGASLAAAGTALGAFRRHLQVGLGVGGVAFGCVLAVWLLLGRGR